MTDEELRKLFEDDLQMAAEDARVPAAGQVWWRAAMRARTEAARAAERPLTWSQGIAAACAVGFAVAVGGAAWPVVAGSAIALASGTRWVTPLAIIVGTCVALLPVVLYFAFSDD